MIRLNLVSKEASGPDYLHLLIQFEYFKILKYKKNPLDKFDNSFVFYV
jgi:hypothetical protein